MAGSCVAMVRLDHFCMGDHGALTDIVAEGTTEVIVRRNKKVTRACPSAGWATDGSRPLFMQNIEELDPAK